MPKQQHPKIRGTIFLSQSLILPGGPKLPSIRIFPFWIL